eukprot:CAMPEP_0172470752 /NCGR_PEP_ID=MMETSP1065-20121228/67182_1 /TAXON_ID=265537 /ORGANISM="Amphiprora paludosa, Strain CCMP125" /LENGTH=921 /DNA_ID=CAMNT_0013228793 /DNA_START=52 /DNA_END=2817 /DNA_ORIENTATION=+
MVTINRSPRAKAQESCAQVVGNKGFLFCVMATAVAMVYLSWSQEPIVIDGNLKASAPVATSNLRKTVDVAPPVRTETENQAPPPPPPQNDPLPEPVEEKPVEEKPIVAEPVPENIAPSEPGKPAVVPETEEKPAVVPDTENTSSEPAGDSSYLDETYDICCVGAGLSGSIIAERYANLLNKKVLIMEKRNHIAGNCYDYVDEETDILVNQYGAHLFHTNYERVWNYVQLFSNWTWYEHRVLGKIMGKHVPVPVGIDTVNQLFGLNISTPEEMRYWLKKETSVSALEPAFSKPRNSEEMAVSRVGKRLYELIFHPYTIKQWAKEPAALGPEVTARIPVRDNYDDRYFADKYQALPSKGYTKFFEKLIENELITVKLNVDYFDIQDKVKCKDRVYFTGPIDDFYAQQGWEKLEYRSLDFERGVRFNTSFFQPLSVVNHPSADVNFTRIVEYKHYLNQSSKDHTVFFYEHSKDSGEPYYPVPNPKNMALFEKYKSLASQSKNVSFVGRLANYKYFNMDQSIKNALGLFDEDTGTKEEDHKVPVSTYPVPPPHDFTKPYEQKPDYVETTTVPTSGRVVLAPIEGWVSSEDTSSGEAWIQLAKAFKSFLPAESVLFYFMTDEAAEAAATERKLATIHTSLEQEYKLESMAALSKQDELVAGDLLIIPDDAVCPKALVDRNVTVVRWLLHSNITNSSLTEAQSAGCKVASSNFAIAAQANAVLGKDGPIIYAESILRPYMTPSLLTDSNVQVDEAAMLAKKENVVAVVSDASADIIPTIEQECVGLACTVSRVQTLEEAKAIQEKAKVVVLQEGCEVGTNAAASSVRLALELIVHGAVLILSPCENSGQQDFRDMPMPQSNIVQGSLEQQKASMKAVLERVLSKYADEFKEYEELRQVYGGALNETTLAWEANSFHHAILNNSPFII